MTELALSPAEWAAPPAWDATECEAWRPPDELRVTEWADRYAFLDPIVNAKGGHYRSDLAPYQREWLDGANCSWLRQLTIMAGTQIGKTTVVNNIIGFAIHQDPAPIMLVVPRTKDVVRVQQRRIMPLVEASPVLKAELTERAHDVKTNEIMFRRAILYIASSESPADLASVPARFLLCDEADKYPGWSGREASPLDLARERQRTFWNALNYVVSTPTTRDGVILGEFEEGDRRRFYLPCPLCNHWQTLKWEQVRWPKTIRTAKEMRAAHDARYHCERCGQAIADTEKRAMLAAGVWVPDAFTLEEWIGGERDRDRVDHRSYHIWAAYSPWLQWWELAAQFLYSTGNAGRMMNWTNSWLAEVFEEKVDAPTKGIVERAQVPGFRIGKIPEECMVAVAGVDVQAEGRGIYVTVRGYGYNRESWLLYAAHLLGGAGRTEWDELEDIMVRNQWTNRRGAGVRYAFIDSRHRRSDVFEFVRKVPNAHMCQGVDRQHALDYTTQKLEKHPRHGTPLKTSVLIWSLTVGHFKDNLAAAMRTPTWHLPEDLPDGYERHVTAEHKVRQRVRGKVTEIWIKKPGRDANHFWDCEVYALAAAQVIQVEKIVRPGEEPPAPPRPRPPRHPRGSRGSRFPRLSS